MHTSDTWQQSSMQPFWSEIAANDHIIQLYETEAAYLNSLEGFAGSGFLANNSVIIIATDKHLSQLNARLIKQGFDINKLIARDQYIPLNAEETLQTFMTHDKPDEKKFLKIVTGIVNRARKSGRHVRAFGEMVALLWHDDKREATRQLEELWSRFIEHEHICVYCAYPKTGLLNSSIQDICCQHTKMISGADGPSSQVFYREVNSLKVKLAS